MPARETDAAVAAASVASNATEEMTARDGAVVVPTASRVPVPPYQAADTVTIEAAAVPPPPLTTEEVLNRLIIHDDKPIENLPEMVSSELKLIGRCVSLCVKQTINGIAAPYYYTGLVSMVTDTTVTLMHVNRYTRVDFKFYQSRERRIADVIDNAGYHALVPRRGSDMCGENGVNPEQQTVKVSEHTSSAASAAATAPAVTASSTERDYGFGFVPQLDPAGSLSPALALTLGASESSSGTGESGRAAHTVNATTAPSGAAALAGSREEEAASECGRLMRPPNFRLCGDSVGPLPYVTFLRTSIHDVNFGRDPTSSFYALFQNPSRRLMDVQFLRTFVRRYLVHTSEHNNPRQVPLYAFLTARGGCPQLDCELAKQVVREELPGLMKADRDIAKEKRKQRNREARLHAAVEEYQAPPGPFANTGVLYLTQIPQQTMMSATIILVFTMGFVLFLIISLTTMHDSLLVLFITKMLKCFIPSMMVWAMAGIFTLIHATSMRLPLRSHREVLLARAVLSVGAIACSIATISVVMNSMSNERIMEHMYERRHDSLCAFYEHHRCSGFYYGCGASDASNPLCTSCIIDYPDSECFVSIWQPLQLATMPLMLFSVFILLGSVNGLMVLLKLYLVGRSMAFAATG